MLVIDGNLRQGECLAGGEGKAPPSGASAWKTDNQVRLAAYNVLYGIWAEPERVGEMFKPYKLDVIGFSEVPDGDWKSRLDRAIGPRVWDACWA